MAGHSLLYDAHGHRVVLGHQIGAGGEGVVFDVQGAPQFVAKWYKHQPTTDKSHKLTGMAKGSNSALSSIAAWPTTTLHKSPSGPLVGFLMPKLSGYYPIHTLYSPANRKFSFPKADWAFLVHTARNLASAIAAIHGHGHVVGDINQGNVLVAGDATVKLIDCDSFQIRVNGRDFLCEVGVPEFTPPELHGYKNFAALTRNFNHDAFGLAVLIFHLIFMGRHPFAGRFLGKGDKPIEDAIREFRFAFGQAASSKQMAPPPHSLSLHQTSIELASLFERAFSESAGRARTRPTAREWLTALDKFRGELAVCASFPAHKFHRSVNKCPWCEIQRNAGPDFFISVTIAKLSSLGPTFDLAKAWAAISSVPRPNTSGLVIPSVKISTTLTPLPSYLGFTRSQAVCLWGSTLGLAAGIILGLSIVLSLGLSVVLLALYYYAPNRREKRKRKVELAALGRSVASTQEQWAALAKRFDVQFQNKLKELEELKNRYESLSKLMTQEIQQLEQARETEQRKDFLERHFIKDFKINGIGPDRRATLLSFGIETLYDVTPRAVDQVPGFGQALTSALVVVRKRVEAQFRFDPTKGVDPAAIAAINQKYALQRVPLQKLLLTGNEELSGIHKSAMQQRVKMDGTAMELARAFAQAKANAAVTENSKWPAILVIILFFAFGLRFFIDEMFDPKAVHTNNNVPGSVEVVPVEDEAPVLESHEPVKPVAKQETLSAETKELLRARYNRRNNEYRAEQERIEVLQEVDKKTLNEEDERQRIVPGLDSQ